MSEHKRNKTALANAEKPASAEKSARDEEIRVAVERDRNARGGFLLNGAVYILSRFPFTRDRYQNWTRTKRIIIGWLLWLIVLPIIPIALAIFWYVRDPEGFKKNPWAKALVGLAIVWAGYAGVVVTSPAQVDCNGKYSLCQTGANGENGGVRNSVNTPTDEAKKRVATQKESNDPKGRQFKNCTEAFDNGVFNIKRSSGSYQNKLDGDNDGIACEK